MVRRFFGFNSLDVLKQHIGEVKTQGDLIQLRSDLLASKCNLTLFRVGVPGVFAIEFAKVGGAFRHVFLTDKAFQRLGEISEFEADSFSVLTEE